ncbi:MAG: hypothetical protein F4X87_10735 [Chloroflexi bacterium]|nr:hypothetical protein [Chloroflexota bacterium]
MLRRQPYQHWLALLGFLLAAVYLTFPIHSTLSSRLIGADSGDAYEVARQIWWFKSALQAGDDVFEQSLLAFPQGYPSVNLWANPLQYFPMWLFAFLLPLPVAYNIGVWLTLALNGWCMYALARRKLGTPYRFPAFIAGLAFILFPAMQGNVLGGRVGLLVLWPAPLFVFFLFEFADRGGIRRFFIAALLFMLAALGSVLQAVYLLAPLAILFVLARLHRRDHVGALRATVVVLAGCIFLLLFLSPVLADIAGNPQIIGVGGDSLRSIDLLGLVSPSYDNPFWRDIATHSQRVLGTDLAESASYAGLLGGLLALLGLLFRRETHWWLLVGFVAWLLALGPVLKVYDQALVGTIGGYEAVVPLPYAFVGSLPVFDQAGSPALFMSLFAVAFSLLVGFGTAVCCSSGLIQRRSRYAQTAIAIVFVFLFVEDYKLLDAFPSVPADIPREIQNLRRRRDVRSIYNVPQDNPQAVKEAMYLQSAHAKPLIAGQEERVTTVDRARLTLLAKFHPSLLQDAKVDIVIIHKERALESGQLDLLHWRARQSLGEPLFEDQRYAVYDTPESQERAPAVYSPIAESRSHITYVYKEQPGWLEYSAVLEGVNRRVHLSLNDTPLETLQVNGRIPLSVPLPIARRGYHTLRIAADPPCPERIDTSLLLCQDVKVENVRIEVLSDGAIYDPIRIEDGIVLAGYLLPEDSADELIKIRLWWQFEAERSVKDVRFVHVLDASGRPVTGSPRDRHFGALQAGSELTETVTLDKSRLTSGEYRVLTGWYELPQAIRYDVLTDVEGAQDDTVVLGMVRIRA